MHIHIQAYTSLKKISDCLIYCILSNGEVIKYHKFIPVVVIEISARGLNTGPEDRLPCSMCSCLCGFCNKVLFCTSYFFELNIKPQCPSTGADG